MRRTSKNSTATYFYSRPCGRGDRKALPKFLLFAVFLLTPLREGRPGAHGYRFTRQNISTHAPAGGATFSVKLPRVILFISTHAPAGGATWSEQADRIRVRKFLLTPLREGRPAPAFQHDIDACISTHAPAGGATCGAAGEEAVDFRISTHAPAGGATCGLQPRSTFTMRFLLTPLREGRRAGRDSDVADFGRISTHAPAGGATQLWGKFAACLRHFYSRPCGRGDAGGCILPRNTNTDFYSRPCGRGDCDVRRGRSRHTISTHAPAGGATRT